MIIDAHAHITREDYGSFSKYKAICKYEGIGKSALFPGGMIDVRNMTSYIKGEGKISDTIPNDIIEEIITNDPETYWGFYCVNPANPSPVEDFVAAVERGFAGLKLAPIVHRFSLGSKKVSELAEACGELSVPFYSHVVFNPGASTTKFGLLAAKFPKTTFILGHMGFGPADVEAVEIARSNDNVFLETSTGSSAIITHAYEKIGSSKLIFGSEFPLEHPTVELKKVETLFSGSDFDNVSSKTFLSLYN